MSEVDSRPFLTQGEYATLAGALAQARRDGKDPVEYLNAQGYLLTERRLYMLRTEALEDLINMLDQTPAHQVLKESGVTGNLAEDYRKALIEMLTASTQAARKKWSQ